ncbi:coiled-coil domain-containing protein 63-like isoform X2 [Hyla sarda]|uniref:coiled-coil domain-containing protein 63-like isoform X2 n=1 Tax=Hyla sarda TaxID=327740 RepID=UPI0024C25615|nr:coiled-coil domain-containing protein 63-like isoform X2 [Hyla sarda]
MGSPGNCRVSSGSTIIRYTKMQTEKKHSWHLPRIDEKEGPPPTEKNLKALQEHFRVVEMTKESFKKQTRHHILSQQKEITQLKEQQKELKLTKLHNRSKKDIQKYKENAKKLSKLTEAQDNYNRDIEEQKILISDLDIKIKEKEEEIVKRRKEMPQLKSLGRSRIAQLENELQHVNQKFNMMNIENARRRESINYLLIKKTEFQNIMEKIEQKVNHYKESVEKIQEQIKSAHEEKTVIQRKSLAFKDKAAKEIKKYDKKIESLTKYVDDLRKQKQFLDAKLLDRSAMAREENRKKRERRQEEMKKLNQEIIDEHNAICEELGSLLGQQDVDLFKMAKQYALQEMKNYSLFTYVNELYKEERDISMKMKELEDEISTLESQKKNTLNEQLISIKQLEEKLHKTSEAAENYKNNNCEKTRDLQLITSATEDLVKNLDCDVSSMKKLFECEELTYQDKLEYFEFLEMKIRDLIHVPNVCTLLDRTEGSVSSISIPCIMGVSEISCSVDVKKLSLPSMPKKIKASDDSACLPGLASPLLHPRLSNCFHILLTPTEG